MVLRNHATVKHEASRRFLSVIANVASDKARPVLVGREFAIGDGLGERTGAFERCLGGLGCCGLVCGGLGLGYLGLCLLFDVAEPAANVGDLRARKVLVFQEFLFEVFDAVVLAVNLCFEFCNAVGERIELSVQRRSGRCPVRCNRTARSILNRSRDSVLLRLIFPVMGLKV